MTTQVFILGNMTLGGRILFETSTEYCIMLVGEWATARIPKSCPKAV